MKNLDELSDFAAKHNMKIDWDENDQLILLTQLTVDENEELVPFLLPSKSEHIDNLIKGISCSLDTIRFLNLE